jgi:hypothetical protein
VEEPLYPNRLHTPLSDDATRFVNESSVGLVERAIAGLAKSQEFPLEGRDREQELIALVLQRWRQLGRAVGAVTEIARV